MRKGEASTCGRTLKNNRKGRHSESGIDSDVCLFIWFNWQMLCIFREYAAIPETYACAVIAATIGEAGICGWIRTTKDRKREHDWERADRKEDNNSEMEEMNDES